MERTWPQRLYLAPSVPLCPYLHSHCKLCPAASTCDVPPRDTSSHSSDWSSQQPVSIYTEIPRSWHHFRILWKLKAVEHQQRINTSCLCVFQYYCLIVFFNDFVYFCQWSKSLLVFFSKTSTVSQWKPLCLVGILFVWCNIHPSRIWLVGWSVAFVSVRRQRKALC